MWIELSIPIKREVQMSDLEKLVKAVVADGKVDAQEVDQLRAVLYADGKIDREEADAVFKINNAVSGHANDPAWETFFIKVISDHLLEDENSPGAIDDDEAKWLVKAVEGDGKLDELEKALLRNLKAKAKKISPLLKHFMDTHSI
jgi:uncharacterized tellurite resistance protein B-like protein